MRIVVAAVGRLKRGPEVELAERYRERSVKSGRGIGLRSLDIIEIAESRARDAQRRMLEESIALANILPKGAALGTLMLLRQVGAAVALAAAETIYARGDDPAVATGTGIVVIALVGAVIATAALLSVPRPATRFALAA